jgi:hypothetical protein
MTQTARAWIGFLVAPGVPAILLYLWGLYRGYGNGAIVGPFLLVPLAYASALIVGGPVYFLLQRKGVAGFGTYVALGAAIGVVVVLLLGGAQVLLGVPTKDYAMAILKGSRNEIVVALVYAAIASGLFWLIAVKPQSSR